MAAGAERWYVGRAYVEWNEAKRFDEAHNQTTALIHALLEYYADFPDGEVLTNNGHLRDIFAGANPKRISYLKVDRYGADPSGRLSDSKGMPFIFEIGTDTIDIRSDGFPLAHIKYSGPAFRGDQAKQLY